MIDIDLGDGISFNVKYKGETYALREPTVAEVDEFRDLGADRTEKAFEYVTAFLERLGMPKDVSSSMGMGSMRKLIEGLVSELDKKK